MKSLTKLWRLGSPQHVKGKLMAFGLSTLFLFAGGQIMAMPGGNGNGGNGGNQGGTADDVATMINGSGNEHGLLVDGKVKKSNKNDDSYTSTSNSITLDKYVSGNSNEVVAFTNNRPMAIVENVNWTTGADTVDVSYNDEILIDVTIWIVYAPSGFAAQEAKALNDLAETSSYYQAERTGVDFGNVTVVDATGDPDAPTYYDFTCGQRSGLEADIGNVAGQINMYYVATVDGSTSRGQSCTVGSNFVALGAFAGIELQSHEVGHDMYLFHIDGITQYFNQTNIMHSASNTREFLTEGQVFRFSVAPQSSLNDTYFARPGEPQRNCGTTNQNATNDCPAIQKRIWADGNYQPN